jgi:hypothetical protein
MPLCNESIGANVTAEEAGGATAIGSAAGEWPGGNLPKLPEESWFRAEAVRVRTAPPLVARAGAEETHSDGQRSAELRQRERRLRR